MTFVNPDGSNLPEPKKVIVSKKTPKKRKKESKMVRVVVLMVKKRAPMKHQEALRRVLEKYGFDPKGSLMYITEDGRQGFLLQSLQDVPNKDVVEEICREVLNSINTATQKMK